MKFNDNLKELRKANNLTQEELAERLNISRQAVAKWESGAAYPDIEKIKELSIIFNITIDDLITEIGLPNKSVYKKKVNRLSSMIIILNILAIFLFIAIALSTYYLTKNTITFLAILEISVFVMPFITGLFTKNYLLHNQVKKLNMNDNPEEKKERKEYLKNKYTKYYILATLITFIYTLPTLFKSWKIHVYIPTTILSLLIMYLLVKISKTAEKKELEYEVSILNKNTEQ